MSDRPIEQPTTEDRIHFHAPHLERVSRSFAFGISRLRPDLCASVGLGYLICRILDTVEDAKWPSASDQEKAFAQFNLFLTSSEKPDVDSIDEWIAKFPKTIPEGERELLDDSASVFYEFAHISERERDAMLEPVLSMSRGMYAYTERTRAAGELHLRDLTDANVYCFFVAGVVGELLSRLNEDEPADEPADEISRPIGLNAIHFGLFLQKINVLKDQFGDEVEGRYLVPDRVEMLSSLRENAEGAFAYLSAIPLKKKDYRLFCAWALYLGLATVPLLVEGTVAPKIPRLQALALGGRIELAISDDEKLTTLFKDLVVQGWGRGAIPSYAESDRSYAIDMLSKHYRGSLNIDDLAGLLSRA